VWDHHPSAEELLKVRIESGWQPTASGLREGNTVLGYAGCRLH
jgi:hypothetical protein